MNINELLKKYNIKVNNYMLYEMWNEPHRSYHNWEHLEDLFNLIKNDYNNDKFSEKTYEKLLLTALFHDIFYDPAKNDNEQRSADFFYSLCIEKNSTDILDIKQAILDTKTHNSENQFSILFNKYDMNIVERDLDSLIKWENGIKEEYISLYSEEEYKNGRLKFLESLLPKYPLNNNNLYKLIEIVNNS